MLLIPAIDLRNGKCVRLFQGRFDRETVYSQDPEGTARRWAEAGARLLHVVDLDGAAGGRSGNREDVRRILGAAGIPVQVGGGLRDRESVRRILEEGAARVILGTAAASDETLLAELCREHPGRILVGIDARDGRVAVEGWRRQTETLAVELARRAEGYGAAGIVFTDIGRDGTQAGPNLPETRRLAEAVRIPVIASGGIGTLDHLRALRALEEAGVVGVICGKALYSGAIDFREGLALLEGRQEGRRGFLDRGGCEH